MATLCTARQAAKLANELTYFNGIPCLNGHIDYRYTKSKVCLSCELERGKARRKQPSYKRNQQIYRQKNRTRLKAYMQIRLYGITWDELLKKQNGKCAICGEVLDLGRRTHMDHKGAKVRGILCHLCNVGLGHFKESIKALESAIAYLKGHQE